jgi:hypothetical protein
VCGVNHLVLLLFSHLVIRLDLLFDPGSRLDHPVSRLFHLVSCLFHLVSRLVLLVGRRFSRLVTLLLVYRLVTLLVIRRGLVRIL